MRRINEKREELFKLRADWLKLDGLLKKKGIALVDLEKEQLEIDSSFNTDAANIPKIINERDEFGLPIFKSRNNERVNPVNADKVFGKMSSKSEVKNLEPVSEKGKNCVDAQKGRGGLVPDTVVKDAPIGAVPLGESLNSDKPKSWSQILKDPPIQPASVTLDFIPLPTGESVVSLSEEELNEGAEKLKCCIMGRLTKGKLPFRAVRDTAHSIWEKQGCCSVFQKMKILLFLNFFRSRKRMRSWLEEFGTFIIDQWFLAPGVLMLGQTKYHRCQFG